MQRRAADRLRLKIDEYESKLMAIETGRAASVLDAELRALRAAVALNREQLVVELERRAAFARKRAAHHA
jgi:hypothetical protein